MKKIFVLFVSLAVAFSLYAQNVASVGFTDSDVKNWAKNCVSIQKELEKIGIDSPDSVSVAVAEKGIAESILQKYGISNPNCIEKLISIMHCATVLKAESQLDEQTKAMMKAMNIDPLAELKKNINSKDYAIVSSNSKAVINAVDQLDNYYSSSSTNTNEENYPDYSD